MTHNLAGMTRTPRSNMSKQNIRAWSLRCPIRRKGGICHDYILGSDGRIRAVVGVDLYYKGKMATVSIWRPRIEINATGKKELVAHRTLSEVFSPMTFNLL